MAATAVSSSRHSSGARWKSSVCRFSSRCDSFVVPGIGTIHGAFCNSQAPPVPKSSVLQWSTPPPLPRHPGLHDAGKTYVVYIKRRQYRSAHVKRLAEDASHILVYFFLCMTASVHLRRDLHCREDFRNKLIIPLSLGETISLPRSLAKISFISHCHFHFRCKDKYLSCTTRYLSYGYKYLDFGFLQCWLYTLYNNMYHGNC